MDSRPARNIEPQGIMWTATHAYLRYAVAVLGYAASVPFSRPWYGPFCYVYITLQW